MVFQKSNPFPKSIFENVAYGPRILGVRNQTDLEGIVERSLRGGRPVGRGARPPAGQRPGSLGRPAAAALHRARDRGGAGRAPHGRAVLGARSDRHRQDRGADARAEEQLHDRHRHPQHAAGGPGLGLHRVHAPGRAGGVRGHPASSSRIRGRSRPRTTSPGGSGRRGRTRCTRHFHEELEALKQTLLAMGGLVEDQIRRVMRALLERDDDTRPGGHRPRPPGEHLRRRGRRDSASSCSRCTSRRPATCASSPPP